VDVSVAAVDGSALSAQNATFKMNFISGTTQTPAPSTPVPITFPPNNASSNASSAPPQANLNIDSAGSKVQITGEGPSVTLLIRLFQRNLGQFMLTDPRFNQIQVFSNFDTAQGVLTLVGSPANINAALDVLRFSLDDDQSQYNQSEVQLALSENGN